MAVWRCCSVRCCGSCAMNLVGVACGRLDTFYEIGFGGCWDVAAGGFEGRPRCLSSSGAALQHCDSSATALHACACVQLLLPGVSSTHQGPVHAMTDWPRAGQTDNTACCPPVPAPCHCRSHHPAGSWGRGAGPCRRPLVCHEQTRAGSQCAPRPCSRAAAGSLQDQPRRTTRPSSCSQRAEQLNVSAAHHWVLVAATGAG